MCTVCRLKKFLSSLAPLIESLRMCQQKIHTSLGITNRACYHVSRFESLTRGSSLHQFSLPLPLSHAVRWDQIPMAEEIKPTQRHKVRNAMSSHARHSLAGVAEDSFLPLLCPFSLFHCHCSNVVTLLNPTLLCLFTLCFIYLFIFLLTSLPSMTNSLESSPLLTPGSLPVKRFVMRWRFDFIQQHNTWRRLIKPALRSC